MTTRPNPNNLELKTQEDNNMEQDETYEQRATRELREALESALAAQEAVLTVKAAEERKSLQKQLEATHSLTRTVVTVERVSEDGTHREVTGQWEAGGSTVEYKPFEVGNYGYASTKDRLTVTLIGTTDLVALMKAARNGR